VSGRREERERRANGKRKGDSQMGQWPMKCNNRKRRNADRDLRINADSFYLASFRRAFGELELELGMGKSWRGGKTSRHLWQTQHTLCVLFPNGTVWTPLSLGRAASAPTGSARWKWCTHEGAHKHQREQLPRAARELHGPGRKWAARKHRARQCSLCIGGHSAGCMWQESLFCGAAASRE